MPVSSSFSDTKADPGSIFDALAITGGLPAFWTPQVSGDHLGYVGLEPQCLLNSERSCVADITGYTGYLNASELEHARGTLTDLLGVLVDHAGPPMRISKLEGDAVFSYAFENAFTDGRTFLDLIESTYVAFRGAIDSMVLKSERFLVC